MSQETLARAWEVSVQTISRWERGRTYPEDHVEFIKKKTGLDVPPLDPPEVVLSAEQRLSAVEAKVVELERRLDAVERSSPPSERPSASTATADKPATTAADLHGAAADSREKRLAGRQRR